MISAHHSPPPNHHTRIYILSIHRQTRVETCESASHTSRMYRISKSNSLARVDFTSSIELDARPNFYRRARTIYIHLYIPTYIIKASVRSRARARNYFPAKNKARVSVRAVTLAFTHPRATMSSSPSSLGCRCCCLLHLSGFLLSSSAAGARFRKTTRDLSPTCDALLVSQAHDVSYLPPLLLLLLPAMSRCSLLTRLAWSAARPRFVVFFFFFPFCVTVVSKSECTMLRSCP